MRSIKRISKSVHQLDVLHRKLPLLNFEGCVTPKNKTISPCSLIIGGTSKYNFVW